MHDPQHTGHGFFDIHDVESIIRAIRHDAGDRLYNSIQVREGKQDARYASVERDLHNQIMWQHMYREPFRTVDDLVKFVHAYEPKNDAQACVKDIVRLNLPDPLKATQPTTL